MRADSWRICPKCCKNVEDHKHNRIQELKNSYGKIPIDEYNRKLMFISNGPDNKYDDDETLREDYEIYMNKDGVLTISYSCSCGKCGFEYEFDKKIQVEL
jgi:hypothetical protein